MIRSHAVAIGVHRHANAIRRKGQPPVLRRKEERRDVRVLIDEAGAVVDLVMDNHVQVLLGVVGGDLLEGEFLGGRHGDGEGRKKA